MILNCLRELLYKWSHLLCVFFFFHLLTLHLDMEAWCCMCRVVSNTRKLELENQTRNATERAGHGAHRTQEGSKAGGPEAAGWRPPLPAAFSSALGRLMFSPKRLLCTCSLSCMVLHSHVCRSISSPVRQGASQVVLVVESPPANAGDRCGFDPWVGKIPWRRKWQPTPVFLAEESLGQRSLVGYRPWGRTESDMTQVI